MAWTNEETDVMKNAYVLGYDVEEIVEYMKGSGHDRSVASVRAKISSLKRAGWEPVVIEQKESRDIDWVIVTCLTIGAIIVAYWWSMQ